MRKCLMRIANPVLITISVVLLSTRLAGSEPQKPFQYDPAGKRDPFIPLTLNIQPESDTQSLGKLVLHGILWDPAGHSIALIDDLEVKTGDTVGGYRVSAIRKDAVVLEANGQSVVLEIAYDTQPSKTQKEGDHP